MSARDDRRAQRAARRAAESGAGPVPEEKAPARFPGASAKFALFGEVLLTGVLVALAGILIVTLPAALAAGIRHLRRFVAAEGSPARMFWRDVRTALPGGAAVGAVSLVIAAVLVFDIGIATWDGLPGGPVIAAIGWVGLVVLAVGLLSAASEWTPELGWRAAVRSVPRLAVADPVGTCYLAAAAVLVGVVTWMMYLLLIPALGCAALAAVAVPHRRGR